jgi:hypothetical protein
MHNGGDDHNLCKLFSCQFYAFHCHFDSFLFLFLFFFFFLLQNFALQTTIKKSREHKGTSFMDI